MFSSVWFPLLTFAGEDCTQLLTLKGLVPLIKLTSAEGRVIWAEPVNCPAEEAKPNRLVNQVTLEFVPL